MGVTWCEVTVTAISDKQVNKNFALPVLIYMYISGSECSRMLSPTILGN